MPVPATLFIAHELSNMFGSGWDEGQILKDLEHIPSLVCGTGMATAIASANIVDAVRNYYDSYLFHNIYSTLRRQQGETKVIEMLLQEETVLTSDKTLNNVCEALPPHPLPLLEFVFRMERFYFLYDELRRMPHAEDVKTMLYCRHIGKSWLDFQKASADGTADAWFVAGAKTADKMAVNAEYLCGDPIEYDPLTYNVTSVHGMVEADLGHPLHFVKSDPSGTDKERTDRARAAVGLEPLPSLAEINDARRQQGVPALVAYPSYELDDDGVWVPHQNVPKTKADVAKAIDASWDVCWDLCDEVGPKRRQAFQQMETLLSTFDKMAYNENDSGVLSDWDAIQDLHFKTTSMPMCSALRARARIGQMRDKMWRRIAMELASV